MLSPELHRHYLAFDLPFMWGTDKIPKEIEGWQAVYLKGL